MSTQIIKHTEADSLYRNLEQKNTSDILHGINQEDVKVAPAIQKLIPTIVPLVETIVDKMMAGGRLFYVGAGTSGRLGIVDASECPPTFGVPHELVIGLIAGGDGAIRKAVEFAEDNQAQGWKDLQAHNISSKDVVIGIAASGTTPYVIGALKQAGQNNITTGCITCNENSALENVTHYPIVAVMGPEFITGSTRMKAGTAQKLILNMISTAVMIKLGRVKDNKMVDMQLSNNKLVERGILMVVKELGCSKDKATQLIDKYGSVRKAIEAGNYA